MKFLSLILVLSIFPLLASAQFKPMADGLIIYVTDGTDLGTDSKPRLTPKSYSEMPTSYSTTNKLQFNDIIRPLGMETSIQAAAFLERPTYGLKGYLLVFCVNDSIGGKQGYFEENGNTHYGVYRLIRPKENADEPVPDGMTEYNLSGMVFILGVS